MKYTKRRSSSPPFYVIKYIWKYNVWINWDWLIISINFCFFLYDLKVYSLWEKETNNKKLSWNSRFITSLNFLGRFSYFDSVLFLLKFLFLLNKRYGLFDFKWVSIKNCKSVKKGKFVMKIFCQITLNKILHPHYI